MKSVEAVYIPASPLPGKWPESADTDFSTALAARETLEYCVNGEPVNVHMRWYTPLCAYAAEKELPFPTDSHPPWDNRVSPAQQVLTTMLRHIEQIAANGCKICFWWGPWHCYPAVAVHLKRLFVHSIMIWENDCPMTTALSTWPVAEYFDSGIHGNVIWTTDGDRTGAMYKSRGTGDTFYATQPLTPFFEDGLKMASFSIDTRITQLINGAYSNDLVFLGGLLGDRRAALNTIETTALFNAAGLRTKIHGIGMRDGQLLPAELFGRPGANLYLDSFATVNVPFIGLMSMRQYDAWESGTLLIQHDTVGELDEFGIVAGTHYVAYNGTIQDMIDKIQYYKSNMAKTEAILRAGHAKGRELREKYSKKRAIEQILEKHGHKWGW